VEMDGRLKQGKWMNILHFHCGLAENIKVGWGIFHFLCLWYLDVMRDALT